MGRARHLVGLLLCFAIGTASADSVIYKCVGKDGVPAYQHSPCPGQLSAEARAKKQQEAVAKKCTRNPVSPSVYYDCVAEIRCDDDGVFGSSRYQCISAASKAMEGLEAYEAGVAEARAARYPRRTEDDKAAEAMRVARNLRYKPIESESRYVPKEEPVDCLNLSLYAKALGDNIFERAAMLQTAERNGLCKRNPP